MGNVGFSWRQWRASEEFLKDFVGNNMGKGLRKERIGVRDTREMRMSEVVSVRMERWGWGRRTTPVCT